MSEAQMTDSPLPVDAGSSPEAVMECEKGCPIHATRGPLWALAGWLAAALATVFVAVIPYDPGESMCGVWGCFPPLTALVSLHLLWCVGLSASVWAMRRWFPMLLRPVGLFLLFAAIVATTVIIADDLSSWLSKTPDQFRQFWPKRVGYRLLTLTDVPLVQSMLVGVYCVIRGRGSRT